MAKQIYRILDDLSPCETHLRNLPRKPNGLYNLKFNEYGQLEKRKGYSKYNTTSLSADHKIVGMHRFYKQAATSKEFLVVCDTIVSKLADTDPWGATSIKTGLTADKETFFVDFLNHFYFVNGVDGVFKGTISDAIAGTRTSDTVFTRTAGTWDVDALIGQYVFSYVNTAPTVGTWTVIADNAAGTVTITGTLYAGADRIKISTVRTVGIVVPGAPTGVSNIDGSLTPGVYYYKYTFVDEDGYESNGGTVSAPITALADPNDGITLTIAASADTKITKRRIYRTTSSGTIFYYEGEVANNTATTYNSTIADATVSLNTVLHTDHNIPPTTSHLIAKRLSRLYLAYAEKLYISHIADCEYFPSDWYIQTGNMQKISGLIEQVGALPVFTDDSIERLVGTDEDNFEFRNAYSTNGNIAYRSIVNCDNLLVYLSFEGLYYFDGVTSKELNIPLNEYIKANINETYASLSAACYFDNKYLLSYPKGVSSTFPNETLYYDFRNGTYGIYSFAFGCYSKWDKGNDGSKLKGGSTTIGQVYSVLAGTTDNTGAITAYDSPEGIDFGVPERLKNYYSIYVKCKTTTGTGLKVYYQIDDESETSVDTPEDAVTADKDRWYRFRLPSGVKGRSLKIKPYISDAYDITFKGYMIEYDIEELQS